MADQGVDGSSNSVVDVAGASPFVTWTLTDLGDSVFHIQSSSKLACNNIINFLTADSCPTTVGGSNTVNL